MVDNEDSRSPFPSIDGVQWENGWLRSPFISKLWSNIKASLPITNDPSRSLEEVRLRPTAVPDSFMVSLGHREVSQTDIPSSSPQHPPILHSLPLYMESELVGPGHVVFRLLDEGIPAFVGVIGNRPTALDTSEFVIAYEWPTPYFIVPGGELSREELERRHLDAFCTDYLLGTGHLPYSNIRIGQNPPDFLVSHNGDEVRLDCTQLTLTSRRQAMGSFERLQAELLAQPREQFMHLAGYLVYAWFVDEEADTITLPPRIATQQEKIRDFINAFSEYRPNPDQLRMLEGSGLPETHPGLGEHRTDSGGVIYAVPLEGMLPPSRFYASTGFELGMSFVSAHSAAQVWKEVARLIAGHDGKSIEHLLITVGGPNRIGYGYPSEEALGEVFLSQPPPAIEEPRNISHVYLHLWASGRIVQVFPEFRVMVLGLRPSGIGYSSIPEVLPRRTFVTFGR